MTTPAAIPVYTHADFAWLFADARFWVRDADGSFRSGRPGRTPTPAADVPAVVRDAFPTGQTTPRCPWATPPREAIPQDLGYSAEGDAAA